MERKTKQDWFVRAGSILQENGAGSLTIDELTTRLGVTKGSFYHHFQNYQDFKTGFLKFYEEESTLNVIRLLEDAQTPLERLNRLLEIILPAPERLEPAFRAWALQDEEVRKYQERIDDRRIGYLQEIFDSLTAETSRALVMARLIYTIYVGSQQVVPPIHGVAHRQLYDEFKRLYSL